MTTVLIVAALAVLIGALFLSVTAAAVSTLS